MDIYNLVSFFGIFVLAGVAWLCSSNRKVINWRVVLWGVGLQLFFAIFIFWVPVGTKFFLFVNKIVLIVLDSATAGTKFLFGRLALDNKMGPTIKWGQAPFFPFPIKTAFLDVLG